MSINDKQPKTDSLVVEHCSNTKTYNIRNLSYNQFTMLYNALQMKDTTDMYLIDSNLQKDWLTVVKTIETIKEK